MFTGIIETTGTVESVELSRNGRTLWIAAPGLDPAPPPGDSIAVDGCCLTATRMERDTIRFDLLEETLRCTNLGAKSAGARVNIERALATNGRVAGHFVQGHVDTASEVVALSARGPDLGIEIAIPRSSTHYLVAKGSIALNGVSLTVASLGASSFTVWIIPHTLQLTNLGDLGVGDMVNLEFDVLAKYVERMLDLRTSGILSQHPSAPN